MISIKKLFKYLCGVIIGFVNGLLGTGGGMIAVPVLRREGLETKSAHATSVAVILPLTVFSAALYLSGGKVHIGDCLAYVPAGVLGAAAGACFFKKIPDTLLRRLFGVFVIYAGIRMVTR